MVLPRVLIDHRHQLEPLPIGGRIHGELVAPGMVPVLGLLPHAPILARTTPAPLPLPDRYPKPRFAAEALYPLAVHLPPPRGARGRGCGGSHPWGVSPRASPCGPREPGPAAASSSRSAGSIWPRSRPCTPGAQRPSASPSHGGPRRVSWPG